MSLTAEIKKRMFAAMKAGDVVDKEILRVAMGEITMGAARAERDLSDEEVQQLLKKLVKSNREALAASTDAAQKAELERELVVLSDFLPKALGVDELVAALLPVAGAIRSAPQSGPAIGVAMKQLKQAGLSADAPIVAEAVAKMRG